MALISVLGTTVVNAMKPFRHQSENPELFINGYLPIPEAERILTSVHGPEKSFIFINQRPVHHKEILKVVRMYYNQNKDSSRYPIFFLNIVVPASSVDVNVTPDKTQVLLHNKDFVLEALEKVLKSVYPEPDAQSNYTDSSSAEKHKIMNTENDGEKINVFPLSENSNKSEIQSHVYLEHQIFSHDNSLKSDLEQVAGKECSTAHTLCSSSDQSEYTFTGNQKHVEISPFAITQTSEIQALKNTTSSDNLTISDDDWSRGNAFRNSIEVDIEPVRVLCSSAVNHGGEKSDKTALDGCNLKTDQKTTNLETEKSGFVTAYDLLNNQVIRKPISAIDIFTQEHRDHYLNASPKVPFDEVPSVILKLWEKLSEEDKLRYEDRAAKEMRRYKTHTVKATKETVQMAKESDGRMKLMLDKSPAQRIKLKTPMSNQQILDKLFHSQVEKKVAVQAIKTLKIDFSLFNLKQQLYKLERKEIIDFKEITLMSKLNLPGAWIAVSKNSIALLNPYRVEEALLYKRLMENHKIPVEKLDVPIVLTNRSIGGSEYFTALLNMQKDSPRLNGHIYLSDGRLTYNGFQIKVIPGSSTFISHVEIEGMNRNIPFYGISDLKEVISFVMNGKTNLCECRPLKVLNYLEGEAVRLARQLPLNLSKEDVQDTMLRMKEQLSGNQKECIHGRPFFHHLSDIPKSND